jgi:sulfate/thiosulfate transport system substrate-binding protein
MLRWRSLPKFLALLLIGVSFVVAIAACSNVSQSSNSNNSNGTATKAKAELTLVSFAVTRAAYRNIIPLFVDKWQREQNQEIEFNQSYGGSGAQTRAVIDGLDADIVALALALDVKKIEKAGLIKPGWEQEAANNSIVTQSAIALVTKEGNPKNIKGWNDLIRPDIKVITANPKTSGGARWNFLGLWSSTWTSIAQAGSNEAQAMDYTTKVFKNTPVLPRDSREATDVFLKQEQGDVLINYENEVLLVKQKKEPNLSFVVPDPNISIDNPVAIVDANVDKHQTRAIAEAFVQFLYTPEAQREFAKAGLRPVDPTIAKEYAHQFPTLKTLFTIKEFGGWDAVQKQFFDDGATFDKIQLEVGRS